MYTKYRSQSIPMKKQEFASGRVLNHIPPVAFPVKFQDFAAGMKAALDPADAVMEFQNSIKSQTSAEECYLVDSGRSALALILTSLKNEHSSNKVVIPAYGCSTILQSVLTAGLEPVFCDVSLETLDMDREKLFDILEMDLLAVVGVHLYGLAHDYSDIIKKTREKGVVFIEDAAQSYGAKVRAGAIGTQGDIGFFSFGRGKCLPIGQGGAIVTSTEMGSRLEKMIGYQAKPKLGWENLLALGGYKLAVNPLGWWFISRTKFNPADEGSDYQQLPPIRQEFITTVQAGIGSSMNSRADNQYKLWRRNAEKLRSKLNNYDFVRLPELKNESQPVYLRFPVVINEKNRADRLYKKLTDGGIGASRSYRFTLPGLYANIASKAVGSYPSADHLAECLITLPTNMFLRGESIEKIDQIFQSEMASGRR